MQEVMFAGFTLEELAEGMRPYLPCQAQADDIVARGDAAWEAAHRDRVAQIDQIHVEEALARTVFGLVQNTGDTHEELGIEVPQRASCLDIPAFGADTSCRFIDAWDPEEIDSITNKTYYNMLPSANRPAGVGADARIKLDDVRPRQYLRYDAERWPSFCGQSATFSMWVETDTCTGQRCWHDTAPWMPPTTIQSLNMPCMRNRMACWSRKARAFDGASPPQIRVGV